MHKYFFAVIFLMIFWVGCQTTSSDPKCGEAPTGEMDATPEKTTVDQGVWGEVQFWEGDFQPICPDGEITRVKREIYIHELTPRSKAVMADEPAPFYSKIETPLVAKTTSRKSGFFQVELPPGRYSIFVREDSLFYANRTDGEGNIYPFTVKEDSLSKIKFDITYKATF
jgi:hypothetical protein